MCAGCLPAGGCMATITPDGEVTAQYVVPTPTVIVDVPAPHYEYVPLLPAPVIVPPIVRVSPFRPRMHHPAPLAPRRPYIVQPNPRPHGGLVVNGPSHHSGAPMRPGSGAPAANGSSHRSGASVGNGSSHRGGMSTAKAPSRSGGGFSHGQRQGHSGHRS